MKDMDNELLELDDETPAKKKAKKKEAALSAEYEATFDGEDKLVHKLMHINSEISLTYADIEIDKVVTSNFKKLSRDDTIIGLTGVVDEWGVVSPIHVLATEDGEYFMLLDGFRRLFAAMRKQMKHIKAIIWEFTDYDEGKEMANILSLMINRSQRYTNREVWEQMQILEEVNAASPGLIEFLLQLNAGEAMKLKDVMTADMDFAEIQQKLLNGEYTIEAAYKKLCNERKKENRLAKEDALSIEDSTSPDGRDPASAADDVQRLSVDDVKEILEMGEFSDEATERASLEDLNQGEYNGELDRGDYDRNPELQNPNDRHSLDPELRQQVLIRDGFTCRCCGEDFKHRLPALTVHHVVQVSQGGYDEEGNLITVCSNCHLCIHTYAWGKIAVNEDNLNEHEKLVYKKIFRYGNIIREANKRCGKTLEQGKKDDKSYNRHMFPGEGLKDNQAAMRAYEARQNASGDN